MDVQFINFWLEGEVKVPDERARVFGKVKVMAVKSRTDTPWTANRSL